MTPAAPRPSSATDAYALHSARVTVLLAAYLDASRAHAARQAAQPRKWGYAGDLQHVETLFARAIEALGGEQPAAF